MQIEGAHIIAAIFLVPFLAARIVDLSRYLLALALVVGLKVKLSPVDGERAVDIFEDLLHTISGLSERDELLYTFVMISVLLNLRWLFRGGLDREAGSINPLWKLMAGGGVAICGLSLTPENRTAPIALVRDVLRPELCEELIEAAEAHAESEGGWSSARHEYYSTQDVGLFSLHTEIISEVTAALKAKLFPHVSRVMCAGDPEACTVRIREAFVVRYGVNNQRVLDPHRDGHMVSFNIALTAGHTYQGGGTTFVRAGRNVRVDNVGDTLIHGAKVEHAGSQITDGARYLLVGFTELQARCNGTADAERWRGWPGGEQLTCLARTAMLRTGRLYGGLATDFKFVAMQLPDGETQPAADTDLFE